MKHSPPRWADRFLAWYCRHDLLEEIQGDVYELYGRTAKRKQAQS
jgi:putative ABC transport system permease protein